MQILNGLKDGLKNKKNWAKFFFALFAFFSLALIFSEPRNSSGERGGMEKEPPEKKEKPEQKEKDKKEKDDKDSVVFHGKILPADAENFAVAVIVVNKTNVLVFFNLPVNPRSFSKGDIRLDGKPLGSSSSVKFNRSGKMLEIIAPMPKIQLNNISSYTGETLSESDFANLCIGKSYTFKTGEAK